MCVCLSTNYSWLNAHTAHVTTVSILNYIWTPEDMCQMKVSLSPFFFFRFKEPSIFFIEEVS